MSNIAEIDLLPIGVSPSQKISSGFSRIPRAL